LAQVSTSGKRAARSGRATGRIDGSSKPDALVTDLTMPGVGGLVVIRAAGERYPGLPAVC